MSVKTNNSFLAFYVQFLGVMVSASGRSSKLCEARIRVRGTVHIEWTDMLKLNLHDWGLFFVFIQNFNWKILFF